MDRQTVYKHEFGYYTIHKENLLKKGYVIINDNDELTVFVQNGEATKDKPKSGDEESS